MQFLPPSVTFVEYVLRCLEHPPFMFVSKLAACCAMLFLTRSDPDLLRELCCKWATRFAMDREKILRILRHRSLEGNRGSFFAATPLVENAQAPVLPPAMCDGDACVDHFLRIVNSLVPMYFSWNWHRADYIIQINREYEIYLRENILPLCMACSAEGGVDEVEGRLALAYSPTWNGESNAGPGVLRASPSAERLPVNGAAGGMASAGEETGLDVLHGKDSGLVLMTLSNARRLMQHQTNGLIILFHAQYSPLSNEALAVFEEMAQRRLLNPMPTLTVVYSVAEPELTSLYQVKWFPTIVYVAAPPTPPPGGPGRPATPLFPPVGEESAGITPRRALLTPVSASPFLEPLCDHTLRLTEKLFGFSKGALSGSTPEAIAGERSLGSSDYELASLVETDGHVVYPINGVLTASALVPWIRSRGTAPPLLKRMKEFVTRVSTLKAEERFRTIRELQSATVMLRRLQSRPGGASAAPPGAERRHPLFVFLGGGMAAGKSTAVTALAQSSWWAAHKEDSVLVNADEFKVSDPLYERQYADVHRRSTRAAESLLVQAVNEGRSIVFDATMMWAPFVEQVVQMVRSAHMVLHKQGRGYQAAEQVEEYFVPLGPRPTPLPFPYTIRLLGITVEPEVAIPRGFLRWFSTNRAVPIATQLRSFKLFAESFLHYVSLVDNATLYNNNVIVDLTKGELPPVLAECDKDAGGQLKIHDEAAYQLFLRQRTLNIEADNVMELYQVKEAIVSAGSASHVR